MLWSGNWHLNKYMHEVCSGVYCLHKICMLGLEYFMLPLLIVLPVCIIQSEYSLFLLIVVGLILFWVIMNYSLFVDLILFGVINNKCLHSIYQLLVVLCCDHWVAVRKACGVKYVFQDPLTAFSLVNCHMLDEQCDDENCTCILLWLQFISQAVTNVCVVLGLWAVWQTTASQVEIL